MKETDRRRHLRIDSRNLVSYVCLDDSGRPTAHGMGRTLNVNETGILLETVTRIDPECTVSLTIGLREDVVHLKGVVVHERPGVGGKCLSGIEFLEMEDRSLKALEAFISGFKARKSDG